MEYCLENIGPFKISYTLLKWCNKAQEGTKNGISTQNRRIFNEHKSNKI